MADRLSLPASSGGQMRMDYGQQALRAQAVSSSNNGTNYSPSYSSEFSALSKGMNLLGGAFKAGAGVQKYLSTDKMTKSQKSALSKYNKSAEKVGEAQKGLSDLKNEMADLKGELDALASAGCEFANQMSDVQNKLADAQSKADTASKNVKSAQAQQKVAQQQLNNSRNSRPTSSAGRAQQREDMAEAQKAITSATLAENQEQFNLDLAQNDLAKFSEQHNSLIPAIDQNRGQIADGLDQMRDYNSQGAQWYADQTNAFNSMGQAMGEAQQAGKDYFNDLKNVQMFDTAGGQLQGWSRAVDSFALGRAYEGGAQAMNQTLSTLSNFSSWTGTGMMLPFVQQMVSSAGQTLQMGGNEVDFGMSVAQGTFGLSSWLDGAQRIENSVDYANAGDSFMTAVELNGAIRPFSEGLGVAYGTATGLGAGAFSGLTPLGNMAIKATGEALQTLGADAITMDQIAEAGGSFGSQLALGITSPFNAIAQGFGEVFDSLTGSNLVQEMTGIRNEFVNEATGLSMADLTGSGVMVNTPSADPSDFEPAEGGNNPDPMSNLSDPAKSSGGTASGGSGSGGKKGKECPEPKNNDYDDVSSVNP